MNIPSRKWVVLAVCSGALGAGGVFALSASGKLAPPAEEKPATEDWLPKRVELKPGDSSTTQVWLGLVPSAFPELVIPEGDPKDPKADEKREEQFKKLCPRLSGKAELRIEPTDDMLRKLLKARLHQGVWELVLVREVIRTGSWNPQFRGQVSECIADVRDTAVELFGGQPKELIPWLEEVVIQAKEWERMHLRRVQKGIDSAQAYAPVVRHRLKAEETLLQAKKK
jgi:hypothetical protein